MTKDLYQEAKVIQQRYRSVEILATEKQKLWQQLQIQVAVKKTQRTQRRRSLAAIVVSWLLGCIGLWFFNQEDTRWFHAKNQERNHCVIANHETVTIQAQCPEPITLTMGRDQVTFTGASQLSRKDKLFYFGYGRARFHIAKRQQQEEPFKMQVSPGFITVLGTEWLLEQSWSHGRLEVVSGTVSFEWFDNQEHTLLTAGDVLTWPRPASTTPDQDHKPVVKDSLNQLQNREHSAVNQDEPLQVIMERFIMLRSQERYHEAADLLKQTLERPQLNSGQQERLLFALGQLLFDQLGDVKAACVLWQDYEKRFPKSRYREKLKIYLANCLGF